MKLRLALFCAVLFVASCSDDEQAPGPTDADADVVDADADAPPDDAPADDADISADLAPQPSWACLGEAEFPTPAGDTVTYSETLLELLTGEPLEGVTVTACARYDLDCVEPIDTATSDADGNFELTLPTNGVGFDGFLEFAHDDLLPSRLEFSPPLTEATAEIGDAQVLSTDTWDLLTIVAGATPDPERGHLGLQAWDCDYTLASGVSFVASTADSATTQVYFEEMVPMVTGTVTDETGIGGFVNLPPGPVHLTAYVGDTLAGELNVTIRPGMLTAVIVPPTPAYEPELACVNLLPTPLPSTAFVEYEQRLVDLLTGAPVVGVTVNACFSLVPDCEDPLATATTDDDGWVSLMLPAGNQGFDGFLELSHDDLMPTLILFNPPLTQDSAEGSTGLVLTTETWTLFHTAAGVTPDETRGQLGMQAYDCAGVLASGFEVDVSTADASSTAVYVRDEIPTTTETETDPSGIGGVFNVPVGWATASGTVGGELIASTDVLIRAGTITEVNLEPLTAYNQDFSCVGNVVWPTPATETVDVTIDLRDLVTQAPAAGVSVTACAKADMTCESPIDSGTSAADGKLTLTLPTNEVGFDGYLEFAGDGIQPTLNFYNPPRYESGTDQWNVVTSDIAELVATAAGTTLDPTRGHVAVVGTDCEVTPVPGISFDLDTADDSSVVVYLNEFVPDTTATETFESGQWVVINVPIGDASITASTDDGAFGGLELFVRAGYLSQAVVLPSPSQ